MKTNNITPINFGYKNILKTLFLQGKLPVTKGFYGDELKKDTVTLEHLKPHSKGGNTDLCNLVLASKTKNNARGNLPLKDFFNPEKAKEYLSQFVDLIIPYKDKGKDKVFLGNDYIQNIVKTIKKEIK